MRGGRENIIHTPELSSDYLEGEGGGSEGEEGGRKKNEREVGE